MYSIILTNLLFYTQKYNTTYGTTQYVNSETITLDTFRVSKLDHTQFK